MFRRKLKRLEHIVLSMNDEGVFFLFPSFLSFFLSFPRPSFSAFLSSYPTTPFCPFVSLSLFFSFLFGISVDFTSYMV